MNIFNDKINLLKIENQFAWVITLGILVAGLPLFKGAIAFIVKLCELFVQYVH